MIGLANVAGTSAQRPVNSAQRYRLKTHLLFICAGRDFLRSSATSWRRSYRVDLLHPATALGGTWLATLPLTAGLVGKLFGVRYIATLIGLTMLSHQLGAFYGAWLGGLAVAHFGDYTWMWIADAGLAIFAALINLPIREAPVLREAVA